MGRSGTKFQDPSIKRMNMKRIFGIIVLIVVLPLSTNAQEMGGGGVSSGGGNVVKPASPTTGLPICWDGTSGLTKNCTAVTDAAIPTQASLHVDDILTALGIASEATSFGTFDGTTIPDSSLGKGALQALETAVEGKQASNAILTTVAAGTETNNSFFVKKNDGTYGFTQNVTWVMSSAPGTDDTYSGTVATFTAGEALAQWDVVYCKNKAGVHACYKYDADAADKAEPPRAVSTAAIDADATGVFLLEGVVRNDGWTFATTNQDEGKKVYASTTAGGITDVEPADNVVIVGYVIEEDVVYFNFANQQASTGSGAPVRANTPTLITPELGAATGSSLAITGIISGAVGVITKSGAYTLGTDSVRELKGYLVLATAAMTLTLPDMAIGDSFCAMARDDNEVLTIDAHANDSITLCPTADTCAKGVAGATVVNTVAAATGAGNYLCFLVVEADNIMQVGMRGTWAVP